MTNINKNPQHKARLSKNGFDVSQTNFFSSAPGMLLPTYWDFLNPGDKIKFSTESFARTEAMVAPTFMKLRQVSRWFFVPLQQLYTPFGSFFYGINDIQSSLINSDSLNQFLPLVSTSDVASTLANVNDEIDEFGIDLRFGFLRLAEFFRYGNITNSNSSENYRLNALLPCAYQKIYNDKFRLSDRESPDVRSWNLDESFRTGTITGNTFIFKMMRLHYAPFGKDFFTNCQVAPLVSSSDNSMLPLSSLDEVNQWLGNSEGNSLVDGKPRIVDGKKNVVGYVSNGSSTVNSSTVRGSLFNTLNTANLRSMFAIEKLSEITRRAAKHYDAQTLAHFGYDVPTGISGEVYEIGSSSIPVQVSDVVSTATTENSPLGDMAGRGNGYGSGKPNKFVAPCHGILMCIQYFIPDTTYDGSVALARENTYKSRVDFYQPEFDRLGMQPLFSYQGTFNNAMPQTTANTIIGWQYRYHELKQKANFSFGAFNGTRRSWVARRSVNPDSADIRSFLVPPSYLDENMVVNFDPQVFANDPLNCMVTHHVYKSSVMSTYGLPKL